MRSRTSEHLALSGRVGESLSSGWFRAPSSSQVYRTLATPGSDAVSVSPCSSWIGSQHLPDTKWISISAKFEERLESPFSIHPRQSLTREPPRHACCSFRATNEVLRLYRTLLSHCCITLPGRKNFITLYPPTLSELSWDSSTGVHF
jgi:hypothetical protein